MKTLKKELEKLLERKALLRRLEENLAKQKQISSAKVGDVDNDDDDDDDNYDKTSLGVDKENNLQSDFLLAATRETERNISTLKSLSESDKPRISKIQNRISALSGLLVGNLP